MNRKLNYLTKHSLFHLLIGLIISIFLMCACKTLQKEPGYYNYKSNTDWRTNKL